MEDTQCAMLVGVDRAKTNKVDLKFTHCQLEDVTLIVNGKSYNFSLLTQV
jgi:cytochrome b involved in lipid metabolism